MYTVSAKILFINGYQDIFSLNFNNIMEYNIYLNSIYYYNNKYVCGPVSFF